MYILKLSYKDDSGVFHEGEYFSGFGSSYVSDYEISEPVLESEVNSVGHFSFTIYPDHPLYKFVDKPKSILEIVRYGKNEPLFIGRMAECTTGFYNEKNVVFESELAFLLDSVRTDLASAQSYSSDQWLDKILSFHNDHSGNFSDVYTNNIQRKFELGKVSAKFKKESFSIPENELSGTLSTLEIISKLFLQKYGGVIKIRHENGSNLIDWLDEEDIPVLSQKIVLSENLLDIQKTKTADEIVTAIRPIGENADSDSGKSEPLDLRRFEVPTDFYDPGGDVKQVINNKITNDLKYTDTLYSKSLVNKYGWIQREVKFDGVTDRTGLSKAAVNYLLGISQSESISISAVDLASASNSIDEFRAGDMVVVNSQIHGMESRKMMVQGVNTNLSDPTQSEITLGGKAASITSQTGGTVSGVSFSGGFSGGTGRYDPEGSASSALGAAKKYTDEKTAVKVDKIEGKGLSTNDFTTAEKNKLARLSNYDDTAVKADISALKSGKANKSDVYTKTETDGRITSKISEVVAGAPEDFDTLKEMSDWISGHEDSAAAMNTAIQKNAADISNLQTDKVDKIAGMGLSENNFTDLEKAKLALLTYYDDKAIKADISALQSGKVDKEAGKGLSSNDYTTTEKEKLAGIDIGANKTVVDAALSTTSTHPVQNKVVSELLVSVNSRINNKADSEHTHAEYAERDDINSMYASISTTLGTQCKNMFNPNAVDWYKASDISISSNGTITSNVTSDHRDINNYSTAEYKINLLPGTYKIIYNVTSYTSGTARIVIFVNGVYKTELGVTSTGNRTVTITLEEESEVAFSFKLWKQTCTIMLKNADIIDNTYEPYKENLQEQINNLNQNPNILYDSGTVTNIIQVTINGLFTNNKLLHVMITGDKYGTRSYMLPLRADINNNGSVLDIVHKDENGTQVDLIHFLKVDNNTLSWFEKQASGAEKYTRIVITKIY